MRSEIETQIRAYVVENFLFGDDDGTLEPETSLLEMGIVDSTGVLELVMYLETEFGIRMADEEIVPENLDSIRAIARYIASKNDAAEAARPAIAVNG